VYVKVYRDWPHGLLLKGGTVRARNYRLVKGMTYSRKEYIHGVPMPKITKFTMGNTKGEFSHRVSLIAQSDAQVRHNALEAARVAVNKYLSSNLKATDYLFRILVYPHHVLRENKMMAFAGADRLQEGMRRAFGKPVGVAARVRSGQVVMYVEVNENALEIAKEALRRGAAKLPTPCRIAIETKAAA